MPWTAAVFAQVPVAQGSVVTSGTYERSFVHEHPEIEHACLVGCDGELVLL